MDIHDQRQEQPQDQTVSERFYAIEQLEGLAYTIHMIAEALQVYRGQIAERLASGEKAQAFEVYRLVEQQREYLVSQIRSTRPYLLELESELAPVAQKLAEQLSAFPLMAEDYTKLTAILKRFAEALPSYQTTNASIIGRLMNNVRLGHYPTDLDHVGYIARGIAFPTGTSVNLLDPCCGTGEALLRLSLGSSSRC